jgi:excinuclease ABC subunit C
MTIQPDRKSILQGAPQSVGVYIFQDKEGGYLYIGKSVNLRARLISHLENAVLDPKERAVLERTESIRLIPAESEFKALVLEAQLIQKHQPRYNKIWRDDKSYLYIIIGGDRKYPRIRLARKHDLAPSKRERHYGPFPSLRVIDTILREIRKVIPYCSQKKISKNPCFHSKIGLCDPCPNAIERLSDESEKRKLQARYRNHMRQIAKILEGKTAPVAAGLRSELKKLSREEEYEEALKLRNRIFDFERFVNERMGIEKENLETGNFTDALSPLLSLLKGYFPSISELTRIECYDISTLGQKEITASMVVSTEGILDKSHYRKFRIKRPGVRSDFQAMTEVFERRFSRIKTDKSSWPMPDLVVVDGGRPQVRTVSQVFSSVGINVPLIGIAKNPDRLIIGTGDLPAVRPSLHHPGFNLIRRLRDESHRFSRKYHFLLRRKKLLQDRA